MKKDLTVSLAKGIGILGVVAHHLANRRFPEIERAWIALPGEICKWAVPLFLVVSGYLHALSHVQRDIGIVPFCFSRARRLLFPYTAISLVYAIAYALLVHTGLLNDTGCKPLSWYKLWWASLTLSGGVGEQLYFLPLLFMVSIGALLVLETTRYTPNLILPVAFTLLFSSQLFPDFFLQLPGRAVWTWDCFIAGIAVYMFGFLLSAQPRWRSVIFLLGALMVAVAVSTDRLKAAHCLFSVVSFAGLLLTSTRSHTLGFLGEGSGTIFIYHTPFFLQPLLVIIATKAQASWHIALALTSLFVTVTFFAVLHHTLLKTRLKRLGVLKVVR